MLAPIAPAPAEPTCEFRYYSGGTCSWGARRIPKIVATG